MKAESRLPSCYRQVVVDTNVIISAALSTRSVPSVLVRRFVHEGQLVFSPDTFHELETRLWRPKFDPYFTMEDRKQFLHSIAAGARWCEVAPSADAWCRDVDDDKFVALALAASVTRLISGDNDLLSLDPIGDVRILSPRASLDELSSEG